MCTVSWGAGPRGYELFFNRDELDARAPEFPPAFLRRENVGGVAPRDGLHGGTWLAVNEFGLTICLLNDYASPWQPARGQPRFSRGHLVANCLPSATHADVCELVAKQPLARTPAFHLLALSPEEGPLVLQWRGGELRRSRSLDLPMLSSSSFATDEVIAARQRAFAALATTARPDPFALATYHRAHDRANGAFSVLMHRPDASTRSITQVIVTARSAEVHYRPVRWTARGPILLAPTALTLSRRNATLAA